MTSQNTRGSCVNAVTLQRLLEQLHPEVDLAAEQYRALHERLVRFFDWRNAEDPEALADEAIDRLAARLSSIESSDTVRDPSSFVLGIARLLLLEEGRRKQKLLVMAEQLHADAVNSRPAPDAEIMHNALDHCLARLTADRRDLIQSYYLHQGERKIVEHRLMAAAQGLSGNTLRNRMLRTRRELETCMRKYMANAGGDVPGLADTEDEGYERG